VLINYNKNIKKNNLQKFTRNYKIYKNCKLNNYFLYILYIQSKMEKNICNFCNKHFKNKTTLSNHIKQSKTCIASREDTSKKIELITCENCKNCFSTIYSLERHYKSCKMICNSELCKDKENKLKHQIQNIKNKYENILNEYEIIKSKYDKILEENLKLKEDSKLNNFIKEQYEKLFEENKNSKTSLENLASKAIENAGNKTINNTTNNKNRIVQNLIPLTDEYMRDQRQYLTYQTVKNGIEGIAEFASNHTFKDRVFCSDVSRLNFIFKSENGEIIKDPEGVELTKKFIDINKEELIRLLEEYLNQILDKLYAEDTDEVEYKIYAKRREEIIATRLAIKKGNIADNTESYNAFKRNFLYALSGLVPR
jgi:hypothetical protein